MDLRVTAVPTPFDHVDPAFQRDVEHCFITGIANREFKSECRVFLAVLDGQRVITCGNRSRKGWAETQVWNSCELALIQFCFS